MKFNGKLGRISGFVIVLIILFFATGSVDLVGIGTSSQARSVPGSSDTLYSGENGTVDLVTLSSEDLVLSGEYPKHKHTKSFLNIPNYRYTDDGKHDGNSSSGYQDGDDIIEISQITNTSIDLTNISSFRHFPSDIIYINNLTDSRSKYNANEDIYHITSISGTPNISANGTKFQTFRSDTRYIDLFNSTGFNGSQPIIRSTNKKLDIFDKVIKDGTSNSLSTFNDSHIQVVSDLIGTSGYDSDGFGNFGEPLYISGGDNSVDAGIDIRVTSIHIFSNTDTNISTIDLGFGIKELVQSGEKDVGMSLNYTNFSPAISEIDPDTGPSSGVGTLEGSDSIVINLDENQFYNSSHDVVVQGDVQEGSKYDTYDISGVWKTGTDSWGNSVVIFDKGNNTNSNSDDLLIGQGSVSISQALQYSNSIGTISYLETGNDQSFNITTDGLFVDIGNDGVTTDDLRLSNYSIVFKENTTVQKQDLDNGLQANSIPDFDKYIDTNSNGRFDTSEPIIYSDDFKLNSSDEVIVNESLGRSLSKLNHSGQKIYVYQGLDNYSYPEPIAKLQTKYPKSSRGYFTNDLHPGDSINLTSFEYNSRSITSYYSRDSNYDDGEPIFRINYTHFGSEYSRTNDGLLDVHTFADGIGFISIDSQLGPKETIYHERDNQTVGTADFGDHLDALTLQNAGTLPDSNISAITLVHAGTAVAEATEPTDGLWVLNPPKGAVYFGPKGINLSVRVSVAPDATANRTVDLRIPDVRDGGTPGAYDPGDAGLFYQQDTPVGGLDPEGSIRIDALQSVTLDVTAEPTTAGNATRLLLEFSENVSASSTSPSDFRVNTTAGERVNVTEVADDDGDANVTLLLEAGPLPSDLRALHVRNGALRRPDGAGLPPLDAGLPGSESRSRARTPPRKTTPELTLGFPEANLTTAVGRFAVRINSSIGNRTFEVRMVRTENGSVPYHERLTVDPDGYGTVTLPALPGRFNLSVTDVTTGARTWSDSFEIQRIARVARFSNRSYSVERGEAVSAVLQLRHATNATIRVSVPGGRFIATWNVTDGDGDGRVQVPFNTTRLGTPPYRSATEPVSTGEPARQRPDHTEPVEVIERNLSWNGPRPGPASPLGAGRYGLQVSVQGNVTDTANLTVTERWRATVRTLVAPAEVPFTDPGALLAAATERTTIARGDTVVLAYHLSGIPDFPPPAATGDGSAGARWRGIGMTIGTGSPAVDEEANRASTRKFIPLVAEAPTPLKQRAGPAGTARGSAPGRQNRSDEGRVQANGHRNETGEGEEAVGNAGGESEGVGTHGESEGVGTHGESGDDGTHGESEGVGGKNASLSGRESPKNGSNPAATEHKGTVQTNERSVDGPPASPPVPPMNQSPGEGARDELGVPFRGRALVRSGVASAAGPERSGEPRAANVTVLPDYGRKTLYVVLGPRSTASIGSEGGGDIRAQLVLNESAPYLPRDWSNGTEERAAIGANVSLEPPHASFEGVRPNGTLVFETRTDVTLAGETNVAPGTVATVHVTTEDRNGTEHHSKPTRVTEDGEYETTLALPSSDDETEYDVWVTANGERISPVRTGRFLASESETAFAATGGTGYDADGPGIGSGSTSLTPQPTSTPPTATPTPTRTRKSSRSTPVPSATTAPPVETDGRVFPTRLPDIPSVPWRIGVEAVVLWGLAALAVLVSLVGFRRLL